MGPEDIELGDAPVQVERRPRAGVVLSVRLSPNEADRLQDIAAQRQVPLSTVAREAIVTYLTDGPLARPAVAAWTVGSSGRQVSLAYPEYGAVARTAGRLPRTALIAS